MGQPVATSSESLGDTLSTGRPTDSYLNLDALKAHRIPPRESDYTAIQGDALAPPSSSLLSPAKVLGVFFSLLQRSVSDTVRL